MNTALSRGNKLKEIHCNVEKLCFSCISVSHSTVFIPKGDNSVLGETGGMEDCHSIQMILNNILMRNWIAKP